MPADQSHTATFLTDHKTVLPIQSRIVLEVLMGIQLAIDYNRVPERQNDIHRRLEQWAKWVKVRRGGWETHPMWREYRSNAFQWYYLEVKTPINTLEALETEKAVSKLPEKQRDAIRWCYVFQGGPVAMARKLAVTKQGLADLIVQGRDMLKNRLKE